MSDHQRLDCLHNRLFRRRSNKTPKFRVTGFCEGNSPVASEFPAQRANNAVKVSIRRRHHGTCIMSLKIIRSKLLPHIPGAKELTICHSANRVELYINFAIINFVSQRSCKGYDIYHQGPLSIIWLAVIPVLIS